MRENLIPYLYQKTKFKSFFSTHPYLIPPICSISMELLHHTLLYSTVF